MGNPAPLAAILGSAAPRDKTEIVTVLLRSLLAAPTGQFRAKCNDRPALKFCRRGGKIAKI